MFAEGTTVVRRDMVRGKVWTAAPLRVVHDDGPGGELLLAHWPGIECRVSTTWIEWLAEGDGSAREQAIPLLVSGGWRLGTWVWRTTAVLSWFGVDEDFSLHRFHNLEDGGDELVRQLRAALPAHAHRHRHLRPAGRSRRGTGPEQLDWKDEDEYAQGRRLGLIGDAEHRRVERARQRALALIESGGGPFAQDWSDWRVQPDWPLPALPDDVLDVPSGFGPEPG